MAYRIPDYGPISHSARSRLEPLAKQHGVTIERMVDTIRARRRFRRATFERNRARSRSLKHNPHAKKFRAREEPLLAGEGELHGLMKAIGVTESQFCGLAGIDRSVFYRWYGHCLHRWPTVLLLYIGWAANMARQIAEWGQDPESYKPRLPPSTRAGRYPRMTAQRCELMLAAPRPKLTRFLVRRATREVFIWTEPLARGHDDLEEVFALTAKDALAQQTILEKDQVRPEDIEEMKLETLLLFAGHKLGLVLDATVPVASLREKVIAAIFSRRP